MHPNSKVALNLKKRFRKGKVATASLEQNES